MREKGTPVRKVSSKVLGHPPGIGSSKPAQISRNQLTVPSSWCYGLRRGFDSSINNSGSIGHPNDMGDIGSSRVSRGRGSLSLEDRQDGLHISPEEVHFPLNLGKRFADSSIVRFVISHYP